jgi:hypothetical protein
MSLMVYYLVFGHFALFFSICTQIQKNRHAHPKIWRENPQIVVVDVSLADRFLASTSLGGPLSAPFGDPQGGDINNDDLKDVQPYPSSCARRAAVGGKETRLFREGEDDLPAWV